MPKVSVLMPVYETKESYLKEAIDSVLNQTVKDFELLILDDGSKSPHIKKLISSYNDARIVYLPSDQNRGLVYQLNKGLELAKGDFIARMDSDDISLKDRFEKQVAYMEKHPETGVLGTWAEVFPEKQIWKPYARFGYFDLIRWNPFIIHPSVMIRASLIRQYNIRYRKEFKMAEDYDLWRQMIYVSQLDNLQEVLFKYRWAGQNISAQNRAQQQKSFLKIQKQLCDFLTTDEKIQKQLLEGVLCYSKISPYKQYIRHAKYVLYRVLWLCSGKKEHWKIKSEKIRKKLKGF